MKHLIRDLRNLHWICERTFNQDREIKNLTAQIRTLESYIIGLKQVNGRQNTKLEELEKLVKDLHIVQDKQIDQLNSKIRKVAKKK